MSALRKSTLISLITLMTVSIYFGGISETDVIFGTNSDRWTIPKPKTDPVLIRLENASFVMRNVANHIHRIIVPNTIRPHATVSSNGTAGTLRRLQIQYWGNPQFSLKAGVYYCPNINVSVRYTTKRGYDVMKKSDVAIFYQIGDWNPKTLVRVRRNDQILAYWSLESPRHSFGTSDLSPFNWTMTYRQALDFFLPYGRLAPFNSSRNTGGVKAQLKSNYAEGKTKLATWVASNCWTSGLYKPSWPRLHFVKTFQKYMPIDTFGKCDDRPCNDCIERIKFYKFYLAFENDQCEDYITEKLFRNALLHEAVPIVFGATRSDYEKVVPKGSFIYVSDFPTVSSLVKYIKNLDKNDSLYNQFFEWRKDFYAEVIGEGHQLDVKKLCNMASRYESSREEYVDKTKWFRSSCYKTPIPRDE